MAIESLALRTAEKHVRNYNRESGDLMAEHREAMDCRECEAFLQLGIDAFNWIIRADLEFRGAVSAGTVQFDPKEEEKIGLLCRGWVAPCEYAEQWIARQQESGYKIDNLEEFRECCQEMRAIVEAQDNADGEPLPPALIELRDKAIDEFLNGETSAFV